jgi:hypothetical protein
MVLIISGLYFVCVGPLAWFLGRNKPLWSKKEIILYVGLPIPITCFVCGILITILANYNGSDGGLAGVIFVIGLLILFFSSTCGVIGCAVAYAAVKLSRK